MNNVPMYLGKNVIKQNAAETKLSPRLSPKTSNLPTRQNNFNKQSVHSDVCINQQRAKLSVSPNELDSKQSRDVIYEIYGIGSSNQKSQLILGNTAEKARESSGAGQITPVGTHHVKSFSSAGMGHLTVHGRQAS